MILEEVWMNFVVCGERRLMPSVCDLYSRSLLFRIINTPYTGDRCGSSTAASGGPFQGSPGVESTSQRGGDLSVVKPATS